jgi:hypothetical protein
MLTSLFTLATLDADHGLSVTGLVGANLDRAEGHIKFLIECFGTGLNALQASHALGVLFNSKLLHTKKSPLFLYSTLTLYIECSKKATKK